MVFTERMAIKMMRLRILTHHAPKRPYNLITKPAIVGFASLERE